MPPRRRSTAPDPLDIDRVREDLAAGKAVRVAIASSAQFPEGASGRVRALGDPDVVGAEFVEVEVTVNGMKDVVPFAPTDLAPPAPRRRTPIEPGSAIPTQPLAPPPAATRNVAPRNGHTAAAPGTEPPRSSSVAPSAAAPGATPPRPGAAPAPTDGAAPATPALPSSGSGPAASRGAGRRPARAIAVALTTTEAEPTAWRVEARVGAKVVLKSTPVSPARAWDLVQSLDNEALITAVGAVLDQHRQATAARAQALAAELAAVQAELAALPPAETPSP